jgi:hypothetical protein
VAECDGADRATALKIVRILGSRQWGWYRMTTVSMAAKPRDSGNAIFLSALYRHD